MQFFLPLMLIIYIQMGGENTKKSKEETLPEIRGWTRITMRGHTPHREEKREEVKT